MGPWLKYVHLIMRKTKTPVNTRVFNALKQKAGDGNRTHAISLEG